MPEWAAGWASVDWFWVVLGLVVLPIAVTVHDHWDRERTRRRLADAVPRVVVTERGSTIDVQTNVDHTETHRLLDMAADAARWTMTDDEAADAEQQPRRQG